jgi:hypothetical protein
MSSLYKRATPGQAYVLRVVEGAVRNAAHAHSELINPRFARSVAKRAAGTLTSQWPEVLAARSKPSDRAEAQSIMPSSRRSQLTKVGERGAVLPAYGRSPLLKLRQYLGIEAGRARKSGLTDRHEAFVDALRKLAAFETGQS